MTTQLKAQLRVCASCEWIFSKKQEGEGCPKCGFAHYGARYVYGNSAYRYKKTQKPWIDRKIADYSYELHKEIWDVKNMTILKRKADKCVTHHYACDCREQKFMEVVEAAKNLIDCKENARRKLLSTIKEFEGGK